MCLNRITVLTIVFAKFYRSSWYIYNVYILHCQTVMVHLPTILCVFTLYQIHSNSMTRNTFLDNVGLDSRNSLTHLLNEYNTATDDEVASIKHSMFYSEQQFTDLHLRWGGLSIISLNIRSINANYTEFKLLIERLNKKQYNNNNNI